VSEKQSKICILNTSILTEYGHYIYTPSNLREIKKIISDIPPASAIGHASTAAIISELLGIDCPVNRVQFSQQPGEMAIIFKLNGRPEEGKVLTCEEIDAIGYTWGLLTRVI